MTDIENLYKRYAGDVRRFALYLCGDVVMADEITSDTFVGAWMAADRIRQPGDLELSVQAWRINTIASHRAQS